jgi:hypothetical protein
VVFCVLPCTWSGIWNYEVYCHTLYFCSVPYGIQRIVYHTVFHCVLVRVACEKHNDIMIRPVHLRRNVGFWTVITVPTVITPYSTVQIKVGKNYGVSPCFLIKQ